MNKYINIQNIYIYWWAEAIQKKNFCSKLRIRQEENTKDHTVHRLPSANPTTTTTTTSPTRQPSDIEKQQLNNQLSKVRHEDMEERRWGEEEGDCKLKAVSAPNTRVIPLSSLPSQLLSLCLACSCCACSHHWSEMMILFHLRGL